MNNKGFTFIEILGVITLLALLSTIIILSVNKTLKDSKETLYQTQIEEIKSAASMWRTDNIEIIPDNDYYIVSLQQLKDEGYIKNDIINPKTKEEFDKGTLINIGINNISLNTEYEKLDYIESTGTQYIDTGVIANQNTGFDIDYISYNKTNNITGEFGTLFGARKNYKDSGFQLTTYNEANLLGHFLFGTDTIASNIRYSAGIITNTRQQIQFRNGILSLPDNTTTTVTNYTFETPLPITLFALNTLEKGISEKSQTRLYSFKIYSTNTLIRNYIPCYKISDKTVGLYDTVNNKFYTNDGTGSFVYGKIN